MRKTRIFIGLGLIAGLVAMLMACAKTDVGLTTKVKTRLAADPAVSALQIDVDTQNGVVTLKGDIDSREAKDKAIEIARSTEGVTNVIDMITVRTSDATGDAPDTNRTAGEALDDAGITIKVKSKLLGDPDVKGMRIDVDTREGVVYLTGTVDTAMERDKAIRLSKETEGVKDVQANLKIEKS